MASGGHSIGLLSPACHNETLMPFGRQFGEPAEIASLRNNGDGGGRRAVQDQCTAMYAETRIKIAHPFAAA
jgi:hypothetical protein